MASRGEDLKRSAERRRMPRGPRGMNVEKPRNARVAFSHVLGLLAPYKVRLAFVFVAAIASTAFAVAGPKVLSQATTLLYEGSVARVAGTGSIDFAGIAAVLLAALALYLFSAFASFLQGWIMSYVTQDACFRLRERISEKINRIPMGYFESASTGDVLSRITNDVDTLAQSLNSSLTTLVTSVVTIVGVVGVMLWISPLMALAVFLTLPVSALLLGVVMKRGQKYFRQQQNALGEINGLLEETFSGHEVVKAFGRERMVGASFAAANERLYEAGWKSRFVSGLMMPVMSVVTNLGYIVVAVLGAYLVVASAIAVGDIQAFIVYVKDFTQPVQQITQVANELQSMAAAAERIFEFLDADEEVESGSVELSRVAGDVVFDHVRFGYDESVPVIRDFSAHVRAGQTVALVGATGAGKTTLVKLLMRFYDVNEGSISIDGTPITSIDRGSLRAHIAMVLQETWLFNGTIRENIRYGNLTATDEEVEQAAKAAYAHHFIMSQPGGYDMVITEDASNISAGQRQLITIARAILANRSMLILDEATSSVDTRTEGQIQLAMENLMHGRTSFVIAHRLSTIRDADLILCIDKGDIVEQGSHEELLRLDGYYARLYNAQFANMA
ncbi:multidrug ABC transporter ATP-binding protein [Denitrobacterium detoxificans]|uniref:Fatty acid ABC transporter ATP-binding/permease protein n=1 Tax=Denitrobacterium detoxificans TaxID=79604 RepID=A0A172RY26_9ACTN|nr:ABC transporter ATP-binding protein [Denitrobacterium detoxificans]ANE22555.1 multidrug ABC transporter ATP-binding protein [Denitrobacterium detoxificans]SEP00065.1 ATP-binding cassette, subfamily B [Denitrobacterium detoxificans]